MVITKFTYQQKLGYKISFRLQIGIILKKHKRHKNAVYVFYFKEIALYLLNIKK